MARRRQDQTGQYVLLGAGGLLVVAVGVLAFAMLKGPAANATPQKPGQTKLSAPTVAVSNQSSNSTQTAAPVPAAPPPQAPTEKAIVVKVDTLRQQYAADASGADARYKDKLLEVTGVVSGVVQEPPLVGILFGKIGDPTPPLLCDPDPQQRDLLSKLKPGMTITVRGVGMSQVQGGFIGMGKCRITTGSR